MTKVALKDLEHVARAVVEDFPEHNDKAVLIALVGDLGAGKTTFAQALAKELGVEDTVQSPTYVLMKSYDIAYKQFTKLVHIDAYRLTSAEEFAALKPESFLNTKENIVCIEWPERIEGAIREPDLVLTFSADGMSAGERYIERT